MRAIRYGGYFYVDFLHLFLSFNPLCVQLDMVKGFKDEFYFAKAIVSIRYACN